MFNFSHNSTVSTADQVSYWFLLVLAAVLPIVVYTGASVPATMTKIFVGGGLVFFALVAFAVASIRAQRLVIPRSLLLGAVWLLPVAYLLSTLFASEGVTSVFGKRLSMDSTAFITMLALTITLTALIVNTTKRVLGMYLAMLVSAALLTVFELVLFFARAGLSGVVNNLSSLSLLGSLNDLAVFFGLITIFVLMSLILLPVSRMMRVVLWLALAASLFFLVVVNLTVLWWIIGLFALGSFVYGTSTMYLTKRFSSARQGTIEALIVAIVATLFLFGPQAITSAPAQWAQVGELDVHPAWQTTASIGRQALEGHAFFGTGPGSFTRVWAQYMPSEINRTVFWQTDFQYGIGFVPTSVITTGLLGAAAWLVFFTLLVWTGVRRLLLSRSGDRNDVAHYLRMTSFLSASFLWVIAVIQIPSPVLLFLASILIGLFIASLALGSDSSRLLVVQFRDNPRVGFIVTLILTCMLLASIGGVYSLSTRYVAEVSFQKALYTANTLGDIEAAWTLGTRATQYNPSADLYYRLLSNIDVVRTQRLLAQNKPPEEIRSQFQDLLGRAIGNATKAQTNDPNNYQNWVNLGTIYQSVVPLGITDAADDAQAAFDQALALRPNSPYLYLAKASLARAQGDTENARSFVEKAIDLRNQYTDAIFLLAQMQLEQNDVANAIKSVQAVTLFDPTNPVAFFQLGLLQYGTEQYVQAAQAFERATALNPVYANAHYFLGLTQWRLGNRAAAIAEFKKVLETNKGNVEVAGIVANLEAGKAPFTSTSASDDIQNLSELPVTDTNEDNAAAASTKSALAE